MIAVALCALRLAPLVWMFRHVEALRLERIHAEHARALAENRAAALARLAQASFSATKTSNALQPKVGKLWAGLSVNRPIFKA